MYRLIKGMELVLASASPRRREMLGRIGLEFTLCPAAVDESIPQGENARDAAVRLAGLKAGAAARRYPRACVIAADTLVVLGETIMGKPGNPAQARKMLEALSGNEHQVVTGFCLITPQGEKTGLASSNVRFRRLDPKEIQAYVDTQEPMDKAGAYGVQGRGAALVEEVSGSYTNVVGLPLARMVELMLEQGVIEPASFHK